MFKLDLQTFMFIALAVLTGLLALEWFRSFGQQADQVAWKNRRQIGFGSEPPAPTGSPA